MKIKQIAINLSLFVSLVFFLVFAANSQSVLADFDAGSGWCDGASRIGQDAAGSDNCIDETWKRLTPEAQAAFGQGPQGVENFRNKAMECFSTSNTAFNDSEGGDCANAIRYCYDHAMDTSQCGDTTILRRLTQCNDGKGTDNGGCGPIIDINKSIADEIDSKTKDATMKSCKQNPGESATDANNRCLKDYNDARTFCNSQQSDPSGNHKIDQNAYDTCMNTQVRNKATSQKECEDRGGRWIGGTDGAQGARCESPAPKDPCEGHGGVDPNDSSKCKDGSKRDEAEGAKPPPGGGTGDTATGRCGEARVNIIACGEQGGAAAFNNVLKIALRVLTLLVGVAAVGGLAWASVTYARAADNASTTSEAKNMIRNVLIGIVLYGFLVAIVNWLVPGSVFG